MNTAIYSVAAFTAYDIVNQIMVSDTGSPLIQAITALEAYVIYGQRYKLFFFYDIGIFVLIVHIAYLYNIFTYFFYILFYTKMSKCATINLTKNEKEIFIMAILVTGGAGYIGSHTCVELLDAGYDVVVLDNLSNSSEKSLDRVKALTGKEVKFYKGDILDRDILNKIFKEEKIDSCIHFAGLKAVGESVAKPWEYYNNNIAGTLTLVDVMRQNGCKSIIFSSSATVYGDPAQIPITEECPKGQCTNPYGWTKSMLEQILMDIYKADNEWNVILLRYFNPIGAHKSGTMGENPNGIPNNLMPYITQVAVGKLKELGVFGDDYDTPDGTGVRDYIHVVDLAVGHVKALKKIEENAGLCIYNLGTGHGYSVLDIVKNFEAATGVKIPYTIKPRRPGDIATCYCDPSKAKRELGWEAQYGIKEMCADSWRWQKNNPNGYDD